MNPALIDAHDGVLFDLDGVLYAGDAAVPGAVEALAELREREIPYAFITNNASRSPETIAEHLTALGMTASAEQVFGSADAGVALMAAEIPQGATVLVTGSDFLRTRVAEAGFTVAADAEDRPAAVLQGFSPELGWSDLAETAYAVAAGARWFATNLDLTIPRGRGIAPGNGALVEAVSRATGTLPAAAGKPEPVLFTRAVSALGLQRPLMIGDRLDTDILGARRAGCTAALVLTGIDSAETAAAADDEQRPHLILETLAGLFAVEAAGSRA
ncbi:HAD-IIA family hydrolase [Nesterenkonia halobia]|uniref:HAD-IIA family hydrolase n=1 Tax=Nesterenkonia halobia TaxID=37922 RepID=A0ABP6RGP9_9MICC